MCISQRRCYESDLLRAVYTTCSKFDERAFLQDFANGNFLAVQWRTETATGDMAQCYEEVHPPKRERVGVRAVFPKIIPVLLSC